MKLLKLIAILLLAIPCPSRGQNIPIGTWKTHLPYYNAYSVDIAGNTVYCAATVSLFSTGLSGNYMTTYDKTTGLSDIKTRKIAWNDRHGLLMVIYENTNIDLIQENMIYNIPDIHRKQIIGKKLINHILFYEDYAYLSSSFGIIVVDLVKKEIKDTYIIGDNGSNIEIFMVAVSDSLIYAATEQGLKFAPVSGANLLNFQTWQTVPPSAGLPPGKVDGVYELNHLFAVVGDSLFRLEGTTWTPVYNASPWHINDMIYTGGNWLLLEYKDVAGTQQGRVTEIDSLNDVQHIDISILRKPFEIDRDKRGNYWIADLFTGLIRVDSSGWDQFRQIAPNGPASTGVFDMDNGNGQLWVAGGGISPSFESIFSVNGFYVYNNGWWRSYNLWNTSALDTFFDFVAVTVHPSDNKVYMGSFGGGLIELENKEIINVYKQNSTIGKRIGSNNFYPITGLSFDINNNLWVSCYASMNPLSVMDSKGEWHQITLPVSAGVQNLGKIVVDDFNQKWVLMPRSGNKGILVYHEGNDLSSPNDDAYKILTTAQGDGNLPSGDVYSIAKDKEGTIWVGTAAGIAVFYCPGQVLTQAGCDAQRILVTVGGFTGYLLETEQVNAIAVDAGNRKWVGTTNGLWLLSPDGTEQIHYFNTENSPLLSDNVISLSINHENGVVFIGTDQGLISYRGEAVAGSDSHQDVYVFPNPVRPDYKGPIAITGLVDDAWVKITDISGTLFYEGRALGGQFVWDGTTYNGRRAKSGVYLVFSANDEGTEKFVTKFLILGN